MGISKIYKRQTDLVKPSELMFPITVIGAGGIGSWVTLALAKMGAYSLTIIDPDQVEAHNIASQFFSLDDVGKDKVSALQKNIRQFASPSIVPIPFIGTAQEYASSGLPFGAIVICAVDSLEQRKIIWEVIKPLLGGVELYIDARMGGEQLRILCVSPHKADSILQYQKKMESTVPADPTPCGARAVAYSTLLIGAKVASYVKKYAKRESLEFDYMFSCATLERT